MKFEPVEIGDICDVVSGATPKTGNPEYWDGEIRWVTPKDLSELGEKHISEPPRKITRAGLDSCAAKMLPPKSVLLSSRAPIGLVAINTEPVCTNQGFKSLVPKDVRIDADYLYWWLVTNREQLNGKGRGATFKEISKSIVEQLLLPLPMLQGKPDLDEQKRIAAILDKADAIRRKRQQALRLTDDFLRSVFLDMFGDPVTNPKGLSKRPLSEFGEIVTGNTPSRKDPANYGDHLEWIKSDNINTPSHYLTRASERLSAAGEKKGRSAPAGSILVTCIAGSRDCIGNAAMADRKVAFNQQINAIIPNERVEMSFLYTQLLVAKKAVQAASTNSMKGMVSKSAFSAIEFLLPEESGQSKFCEIFELYEHLLSKAARELNEADDLFASLQQRAFRGEL